MDPAQDSNFGLGREEIRQRQILPKALLIGAVAGLLAAAFRLSLSWSEGWRSGLVGKDHSGRGLIAAVVVGGITGAIALWTVKHFAPEASGSGIPFIKRVVSGETKLSWRRILPVKFIAGVLGIGGGLALGREGPTIQMGGATGLMVGDWLRVQEGGGERKALISAGAGAGLAAAFNAPLAGMVFVLEELHGSFTPAIFVSAFVASVTSDIVARLLAGSAPVFAIKGIAAPGLAALPGAAVAGVLAGLVGAAFNWSLLASLDFFGRRRRLPPMITGAAIGGVSGLAGWIVPGLAGSGGGLVTQALAGRVAFGWLPLLMVVRLALTVGGYGCGAAGGIFLPMFVIGALGGLSFGGLAHHLAPVWFSRPEVFVILGMGGIFSAIVRAPLTGLVLMIELTGTYDFMLPLLVCSFAAYGIAEALGCPPIYEALRQRQSAKQSHP
ncbi:MAG TPA: H(+)/Cl(-) exchange transporter ClcA [Opitutaceae bacterium]|jgi:CIC family chloride channel protein|nr:H(+)/Cl(-) exchange transporter ClcA [Opitutaceae bacterium]